MACVKAKDREAWLELWADDGCVEDPVGVSFLDPTGKGHTGKEAIGKFFDANIGILRRVEFDIRHSYATGDEVANVGTIHLYLPDGAIGHCEGVFVYRVREDGKLVSLRAFWEIDQMMAAMEPGARHVNDRDALALQFAALCSAAGQVVMDVYATDFSAGVKSDASPVTEADERAEVVLLEGLASLLPGVAVVAEEAVSAGGLPAVPDEFLLVDPLDGTKEFVSRNGDFTVNVALVRGGSPVAGAVYAPARSRMYVGGATAGVVGVVPGEAVGSLSPVQTRDYPPGGLVAVASKSHLDDETRAFLDALSPADSRSAGSSLKFCLVASGVADVYPRFGPTMEWDIAAGHAVLAAAGGQVLEPDGSPFRYGKVESGLKNGPFVAWGRERLA